MRYTLEIPVIEVENEIICMGIVREEALKEKLEEVSNRMR